MFPRSKNVIPVILLSMIILLGAFFVVTPVHAQGVVVGKDMFPVSKTDVSPIDGVGPNIYYGQPVRLEYTLILRWSSITYPNGDVRQTITARGTVEVYLLTDSDNPFDTRRCIVSILFYDMDGDACTGVPGGFYEWNPHDPITMSNMEQFDHRHTVLGVYTRRAYVYNGVGGGRIRVFTHPPTTIAVE